MKTATKHLTHGKAVSGLSLVELLVAIGVLAIICAIGIPSLSQATDSAGNTTAKRNAQTIASIANSAAAAGLDFVDPDYDLEKTIGAVVEGGVVKGGVLDGTRFGMSELSMKYQQKASKYLTIESGTLVYLQNGKG